MDSIDEVSSVGEVGDVFFTQNDPTEHLVPIDSALETLASMEVPAPDESLSPKKVTSFDLEKANEVQNAAFQSDAFDMPGVSIKPAAFVPLERCLEDAIQEEHESSSFIVQEDLDESSASIADPDPQAAENKERPPFPNLAYETVDLALKAEALNTARLKSVEDEVSSHLDTIDKLLALNTKIDPKKDQEISDSIREQIQALQEIGVDLNMEAELREGKISKEKAAQIKSVLQSQIDKNRSKIQNLFTKIQSLIQYINSIMDTTKNIVRNVERQGSTLTRNQRPGT